jgi:sirohydrochlorin ferrochelatase
MLAARTSSAEPGVLLLAHGGSAEWNARVTELAAQVDKTTPTEVAFGMATRSTMQAGIDQLVARGATEVVAVPLFISSWSSIITSTEYFLGLRTEAPAALALYAKMSHRPDAAATSGTSTAAHDGHPPATDGTTPIRTRGPVRMTPALNDHPTVAEILASRAASISHNPANEALVIVAHGPKDEDDNRRWLADMKSLANHIRTAQRFASIDSLTLRDDAPKPIRDAATAELRDTVVTHSRDGWRVRKLWEYALRATPLAEAEVTCAQALERGAIRSDYVGIERICGRHEPCVILAHPACGAPLQKGTPPRLRKVQSLNRKPLQRCESCGFVDRAFQDLFHGDDRDNDATAKE